MESIQLIQNALLNIMTGRIVTEADIKAQVERGSLRTYSDEMVKVALDDLMTKNKIRWIAFRGYTKGGRP